MIQQLFYHGVLVFLSSRTQITVYPLNIRRITLLSLCWTRSHSVSSTYILTYLFFCLNSGLWGYWHCGHSWPIVPASGDSEDYCDGMWMGRGNLPQRHFCPSQNLTWTDPGLNPGRRGGKPANIFLLCGLWGYWHCGHSWPIVPASGDSEDDCGEADGM
jgi:hypothetical protein